MRGFVRLACLLLFLLGGGVAFSLEENLDDLLTQDEVITEKPTRSHADVVRPVFLYFGNLETQGVAANGWQDLAKDAQSPSLWYFLHLQGGIDVMPVSQARLIGTFSTYLPQGLDSSIISNLRTGSSQTGLSTVTPQPINTSASIALDDLYLDYSLYDSASFRIGKFSETWGQGRLFNPGNLVAATSDGVNLRGFGAWGPLTFTGLLVGSPGYFADVAHPRADEMGYAGALGFSWGAFTGGTSAFTQAKVGQTYDLYLRSSLLGFDIFAENLWYLAPYDTFWPGLFFGFFREVDLGWKWRVVGEYWIDGSQHDLADRNVGLGATSDPIVPGLDLKISTRWLHSMQDSSGQLVLAAVISPLPKMNIGFGVPWTYGAPHSQYIKGNSDPEKRVLAGIFNISVKFDFEKEW